MTGLTTRGLWVVVAVLAVVLFGTVWAAGSGPSSGPATGTGSVRLGPEPGQDVAQYLASLPAQLPPPGPAVPALVQLDHPLDAAGVAALAGETGVGTAVFRVPFERVQTALRFEPVAGAGGSAPERSAGGASIDAERSAGGASIDAERSEGGAGVEAALGVARERAAFAADADADRARDAVAGATDPAARASLTRRAEVAGAERRALADPGCACMIALVVTADRAGLEDLSARDGVRAVQAAPPRTDPQELALSPLLPQQVAAATPPPDDGPVPTG